MSGMIGSSVSLLNEAAFAAKPVPTPGAGQKIRVLLADDHALFRQ